MNSVDAARLLERAQNAKRAGRLDDARHIAAELLEDVTGHADARCLLAEIALEQSDREEAIRHLEVVLGDTPSYPPALTLLDSATSGSLIPVVVPARAQPVRRPVPEARPLVSVTVASFNHERFIQESLGSLFAQAYSPLEILIGDDASVDDTPTVIEQLVANYKGHAQVAFAARKINLGRGGIGNWLDLNRRAKGDIIVRFSADDVMQPDMIERVVATFNATGASLVTVNAEYIDSESHRLGRYIWDPTIVPDTSLETLVRDGATRAIFGSGMSYTRELIEVFPLSFNTPPENLLAQDLIFNFYAGLLNGVATISEPMIRYRVHGAQASLSLAWERETDPLRKHLVAEKIWLSHLTHAVYMTNVLIRLAAAEPARYGPVLEALHPLVFQQTATMAQRLVDTRARLYYDHGVREITSSKPPPWHSVSSIRARIYTAIAAFAKSVRALSD